MPTADEIRAEVLKNADAAGGHPDCWVTKVGEIVKIASMPNGHLLNAMRLCMRRGGVERAKKVAFYLSIPDEEEVALGDGASMALEMETDAVLESTWNDHVDLFFVPIRDEAQRRGLSGATQVEIGKYGARVDAASGALGLKLMNEIRARGLDRKILAVERELAGLRAEKRELEGGQ